MQPFEIGFLTQQSSLSIHRVVFVYQQFLFTTELRPSDSFLICEALSHHCGPVGWAGGPVGLSPLGEVLLSQRAGQPAEPHAACGGGGLRRRPSQGRAHRAPQDMAAHDLFLLFSPSVRAASLPNAQSRTGSGCFLFLSTPWEGGHWLRSSLHCLVAGGLAQVAPPPNEPNRRPDCAMDDWPPGGQPHLHRREGLGRWLEAC